MVFAQSSNRKPDGKKRVRVFKITPSKICEGNL